MNAYENTFVKAASNTDKKILRKLSIYLRGQDKVYYHNAPRYWVRAMAKPPYFWNEKKGEHVSSHIKYLAIEKNAKDMTVNILNSNLFYWWFLLFSNSRDLSIREIERFPFSLDKISLEIKTNMKNMLKHLSKDYEKNKVRKECYYQATGNVKYDEYYPKYSKPIIDQIDTILARHYGFTEEELDFIINYDIKYRMGKELEAYVNGTLGKENGKET